ncbi:glycosyltransferase [Rhizobium sp. VS19-DR104.2]|uniref:glycosyltransferase n=1 Tax=unclassified Rhizobium TaxID=2613769 RepID=UPI001CC72C40|nr:MULTISPECIES: glycosyltransferase [unclassified Rhizobium]MBZ5762313.1 glycosyltransferase [Rhizobium sp. VS19-DR96]MBZ5768329.1 glycosyltransferase [Rhizobium sp. VS19-DR129.2]MBZ5775799.1 glycosyltransferase [Rhizobium sp. VS19-DRK62.2]MBZ5787180.1 glycosyltransferase [Rhizobium sp. VS19-DR121]MBZ5804255.1 glycosyltransferase [Rhizobium sp. VS19-DR181]
MSSFNEAIDSRKNFSIIPQVLVLSIRGGVPLEDLNRPRGELHVLRLTGFYYHKIADNWPPEYDSLGGQQIQTTMLSEWLANRGVRQRVLTLGFPGIPRSYDALPTLTVEQARFWMPEIRSRTEGLIGLTNNWMIAVICRLFALRADRQKISLIHVHADGQIEALLLARWSRLILEKPVVLTLHCSRLASYKPMTKIDTALHRFVQRAEIQAANHASDVICLNNFTSSKIISSGVKRHKIHVVPDATDFPSCSASSVTQEDTKTCLFVGRIAHEKGWADALSVFCAAPLADWKLIFVGDGPQRQLLESEIRRLGVGSRVSITGFVAHHKVQLYMREANAIIMPSRHEEFGGAAIEAMASATPVVGYACGGLSLTVGAVEPKLLSEPGNPEGLVRTLVDVGTREPYVLRAIDRGVQWVNENCSPDIVYSKIMKIYEDLTFRERRDNE